MKHKNPKKERKSVKTRLIHKAGDAKSKAEAVEVLSQKGNFTFMRF